MLGKIKYVLFVIVLASLILAACVGTPEATQTAAFPANPDVVALQTMVADLAKQISVKPTKPTPVPDTGGDGEESLATETPPEEVKWNRVPLAKYFETVEIGGETWVLPLGTHFATDLSNGRYEAIPSAPAGPQPNGADAGWCKSNQYGCPPHLGLYRTEVTSGVEAIMDIPTRIMVTSSEGGKFHMVWRFNTETRSAGELMDDYVTAASQGQLGLFIATKDGFMEPVEVTYQDKNYLAGYGCWDCLAHTRGPNQPVVMLDAPDTFGTPSAPTGDSLYPAIVVPVPAPGEDPDFVINLIINVPAGTEVVLWFGRYDPTQ